MAQRLSAKELEARYTALDEAAEHLLMNWTDDPIEQEQGVQMSEWLKKQSLKWLEKSTEVAAEKRNG